MEGVSGRVPLTASQDAGPTLDPRPAWRPDEMSLLLGQGQDQKGFHFSSGDSGVSQLTTKRETSDRKPAG